MTALTRLFACSVTTPPCPVVQLPNLLLDAFSMMVLQRDVAEVDSQARAAKRSVAILQVRRQREATTVGPGPGRSPPCAL
mmetsp:Transcript_38448/g.87357  ORF Transcript_38448/g.87357 Transcript_38448/m.87357 type:complete len:80 (-) Transcript_38448:6-245(-)